MRWILLLGLFLLPSLTQAEIILESGPGQDKANVVVATADWPLGPEGLRLGPTAVLIEREGSAAYSIGADMTLDRGTLIEFTFGVSWWESLPEKLSSPFEYHLAIRGIWGELSFALHHWSNGSGFPFGDCDCSNLGENALVVGWVW